MSVPSKFFAIIIRNMNILQSELIGAQEEEKWDVSNKDWQVYQENCPEEAAEKRGWMVFLY